MKLKSHDHKLVVYWMIGLTLAVPLLAFATWVTAMTGIQNGISSIMVGVQTVTMLAVMVLCIKRVVACYQILMYQIAAMAIKLEDPADGSSKVES